MDDQTAPGTVDGVFRRTAGGTLDVTYYLERSAALGDPTQWTTLAPITLTVPGPSITVTNKGDGTDIVRISNMEQFTGMLDGEGFVRMKVISHGETSYADVLGWTETKLGPTSPDPYVSGCSTYNNPYLHCATFTGTVDITDEYNNTVGVSGNTLGFTNSAGPISMASLLKPGVAYYLEVVNGTYDGHRYDVDAATANTVTLKTDTNVFAGPPFNTLDVVPIDLEGSQVIIRSHRTLGEMFPVTSFHADGGPESADQVQTYTEGRWTTYWLKNTTPAIWVELLGDGSDKAATVIPPGQGMFVLRRTSPISILSYGEVRENVFVRPLSQGLNLVGGGYPIDQSANGEVSGRGMDYMFGFYGSRDFKTADSFFIWKGDTTTGATGYDTYWLLHSEVPQHFMDRWVMAGDATLAPKDDTILFQSDRSVFIRMKNELDTYAIIPTPWDPNPSPWPPDDNPFPQ